MVQLRTILVIFVTLLCREFAGDVSRPTLQVTIITTTAMVLGFGLLFRSFAVLALCRNHTHDYQRLVQLHGHRKLTDWLWCAILPFALIATGWAPWLRHLESVSPMVLAIPAYFLPTVGVILLFEKSFAEFELMVDSRQCSALAESSPIEASWWDRFYTRLKLGELASLLTCLVPVALMMLFNDLAHYLAPWLPLQLQGEGISLAIGACLTFAVLAVVYPAWLSKLVGAVDLAEPLAGRVHDLQRVAGVGSVVGKLVLSQGRWSSAAIVGWLPRLRHLWLGDRLLQDLTIEEIDMVILHELAHIKRCHFVFRLLPVVGIGLAITLGYAWFSPFAQQTEGIDGLTKDAIQLQDVVLWGAAGCALVVSIGFIARRCELDADTTACRLAVRACSWSDQAPLPAEALASALVKLHDRATARGSWLHPALRQRLDNLGVQNELRKLEKTLQSRRDCRAVVQIGEVTPAKS